VATESLTISKESLVISTAEIRLDQTAVMFQWLIGRHPEQDLLADALTSVRSALVALRNANLE
jgi:hypothetical protein